MTPNNFPNKELTRAIPYGVCDITRTWRSVSTNKLEIVVKQNVAKALREGRKVRK